MKTLRLSNFTAAARRTALGFATALGLAALLPAPARAADAVSLRLAGPANGFAEKFLATGQPDDGLPAFLAQHAIGAGAFAEAVRVAVAFGRAAQAAGLQPGTPAFRAVLAASHGDADDGTVSMPAPAATTPPKSDEEKDRELRKFAASRLRGTSATRQYFIAHTVGVEPPGFPSFDRWGRDSACAPGTADAKAAETKWREAIADPQDETKWKVAPGYDAFLLRYGARLKSYEKKTTPAGDAPTPATSPLAAETETAKKAAAAAEGSDVMQKTRLRDAGFSIGYGFGTALNADGDTLTPALFRWNLYQRRATIMWNDLVSEGSKANPRKRISYYGKSGSALIESQLGPNACSTDVAKLLDYRFPYLTSCGPFLGRSLGSQKVWFGATDDAGNRVLESPFIAGWSVGFGFIDEAASAVCVDVGATISPSSGFRHSRPYVGISVDGIVAGKLLELLRLPALTGGGGE